VQGYLRFEVFGSAFSTFSFRSTITTPGAWNLIDITIQPAVAIGIYDLLVVEFPTSAIDGYNGLTGLFSATDSSRENSAELLNDVVQYTQMFNMSCRYYPGAEAQY
jgi:hypothetical protein